ncbi:hypothetical protein [Nitrosopumilus sp.]|uniref:hypothetical protein n=1 Tax=Nitrosopumilus sp. TaxID=2024843 RepID=UPI0026148DDF|nr:hypothetical protein [Nitrosopumilus sp.]
MTCKGICVRYKAQKPVGTGRYASGQRRCQICEIFIKWEGLWCPCCGYRLRTKPRNLKYKAKLRARVEADSMEAKATTTAQSEVEVPEITAKTKSKAKTSKKTTEEPKRKGTIMEILKRERELRKEGNENEAIDELLEKEFGKKRLEKVKTSKTWIKHHVDTPQDESIAIKA